MKTQYTFALVVLLMLILQSCGSDNYETVTEIELNEDPVVVEYDNALAFATARGSEYLQEGIAYQTKNPNGNSLFTIASEFVTVECPGSATSYNGGGVFFLFQFVQTSEGLFTFSGNLTAEIDGKQRAAFFIALPDCEVTEMSTEYEINGDRIEGTITGEYFYFADEFVEPFESCENFVSTGELIVNFDLPLTVCN